MPRTPRPRVPAPHPPGRFALTDQRAQELCAAYQAGTSIETLALDYGVAYSTAHATLKRYDIPRRPQGPRVRIEP